VKPVTPAAASPVRRAGASERRPAGVIGDPDAPASRSAKVHLARGAARAFALTAINSIFGPSIAALYARGDRSGVQTVLSLFGDGFASGSAALRILLLGQLVNATAGSVGVMLTMTGHERQAAVVMMVAAAGQIGLSVALIPRFGVEGAAVANAVSLIGWNLALAVPTWRKLRIVPSILARR
jgi:O-antigen/teichoic acid export membrane protein